LLFLQRLAVLNLMLEDLEYLVGWIAENKADAKRVCCYLEIIRCVADNIRNLGFPAFSSLLFLVRHDDPAVVVAAIDCLWVILGRSFYLHIHSIVSHIQANEAVAAALEPYLTDKSSDLFAVLCAIALRTRSFQVSVLPPSLQHAPFWYYYPLRLYIASEGELQTRLGYFIVGQTLISSSEADLHSLFCAIFLLLLPDDVPPFYDLMHIFVTEARNCVNEIACIVFLYGISLLYFRLKSSDEPSGLINAFANSIFADPSQLKSAQRIRSDPLSLFSFEKLTFTFVGNTGPLEKQRALLAAIGALGKSLSAFPAPIGPDQSTSLSCDEIRQGFAAFPPRLHSDLPPDAFARFDEVVVWVRAVLQSHLLLEGQEIIAGLLDLFASDFLYR
jgi:hypothetical protein